MHYGGRFKEYDTEPYLVYTSDKFEVCENYDLDYLSLYEILTLFKRLDSSGASMYIWFQVPLMPLSVGKVPVENDKDVRLLIDAHKGLSQLHLYLERGEIPLLVVSSEGKILFRRPDY